jgi:hypothetical protein
LKALIKFGGKAKPAEVYPEVEKIMGMNPKGFPEEYEKYKRDAIKWKNKTAWARGYLKRKNQLDGSERGILSSNHYFSGCTNITPNNVT